MASLLKFEAGDPITATYTDITDKVLLNGFRLSLKLSAWNSLQVTLKNIDMAYGSIATYPIRITNNRSSTVLFHGITRSRKIDYIQSGIKLIKETQNDWQSVYCTYGNNTYTFSGVSESSAINTIIGTFTPDPTTTHIITGSTITVTYSGTSIMRAIEQVAAINGRLWYWDGDQEFHYFASTGETAPFALSDAPNGSTTFPYGEFAVNSSMDDQNDITVGGSLVCWKDGLWPGMALSITNSDASMTATSVIINEIEISCDSNDDERSLEYKIYFGDVKKPRVSDLVDNSKKIVSTFSGGQVPILENDTTKYFRSDGTYAVPPDTNTTVFDAAQQTQADFSPDRALGTIYQNTTGKVLLVAVSAYLNGDYSLTAQVKATSAPDTQVGNVFANDGTYANSLMVYFIVPKNYYYRVTEATATGALNSWTEWQIG